MDALMEKMPSIEDEGQVIDLTEPEAKRITADIRTNLAATYHLIQTAWTRRIWVAMGYESWDAYVAGEFADLSLTPPLEKRTSVVASMAEAGMSVRAIGAATQMSKSTTARTIKEAKDQGLVEPSVPSTGLDGKSYRPASPKKKEAGSQPMTADDLDIGRFVAPESKAPSAPRGAEPQHEEQLPGMPEPSGANTPADGPDLEAVKAEAAALDEVLKEAIIGLRQSGGVSRIDAEVVSRLVSALLASAGLLDELSLSRTDLDGASERAAHLEIAVTTLDKVLARLKEADDEQS